MGLRDALAASVATNQRLRGHISELRQLLAEQRKENECLKIALARYESATSVPSATAESGVVTADKTSP